MQGTPEAVPEESGTPDSYSAETFPRSFRIQRSGSADSLASLVSHSSYTFASAQSSASLIISLLVLQRLQQFDASSGTVLRAAC